MGKDPTIPFYAQDFYMDTLQWSENEVGAYIRLLCSMWINGFCYNSAIELANISPLAKQVVDKYPDKFIFFDDNKFSSKRLEIERDKRIKHRELRSIAGKKGAESRWQTDSKDYGKKITKVNEKENEDVNVIYNKWNDKKIIVHNKFTDDIKARIISKNKDYTTDQIIEAIDNYAIILNGDYYFKYKWTLKDFLQRGIDKFLNLQIAKDNYKSKPINNGDGRGVKRTHAPLSKERQEEYSKL